VFIIKWVKTSWLKYVRMHFLFVSKDFFVLSPSSSLITNLCQHLPTKLSGRVVSLPSHLSAPCLILRIGQNRTAAYSLSLWKIFHNLVNNSFSQYFFSVRGFDLQQLSAWFNTVFHYHQYKYHTKSCESYYMDTEQWASLLALPVLPPCKSVTVNVKL